MNSLNFSQRGVTLIEILIALTLSIIIILAMLRAFVTTGKVTAEASLGAQTDSGLMLGLIATDVFCKVLVLVICPIMVVVLRLINS